MKATSEPRNTAVITSISADSSATPAQNFLTPVDKRLIIPFFYCKPRAQNFGCRMSDFGGWGHFDFHVSRFMFHDLASPPLQTHRVPNINSLACIGKLSCFFVNFEYHNVVAVLIGNEKEIAGEIEIEIAGCFAKC